MSQSGYTPILIYASGTATNLPLAADLTSGASGAELALNYADGKLYYKSNAGVVTLIASSAGSSGDVVGPASATDNALARFDLTTGKLIQNSVGILSDAGVLTGLTGITSSGSITLSSLTSGRVTFAGASGLLTDSANLTFNGTILTSTGFAGPLDGTVGAITPAAGTFTSLSDSGNLTFTGTGNRITGDFSNATVANRVMFQTSTTNGGSVVGVLPNGTGTITQFAAYGGSDPANAQVTRIDTRGGTESRIESTFAGTPASGTYLPMTFYTGGSERMRVDTSGNVGIGTSSPGAKLQVQSGTLTNPTWAASDVVIAGNSTGNSTFYQTLSDTAGGLVFSTPTTRAKSLLLWSEGTGNMTITNGGGGNIVVSNNGSERMRIDSSGNVLVTNPAGLGYGTGSGGTVTQATSRATSVTINKPTGAITLFAAVGSPTPAKFSVSNSVVAATDTIIVSVKSSTNIYRAYITAVAAAGFDIAFESVSGVASDSPVFNFAIIRGATS